jgi:hypothetical protein
MQSGLCAGLSFWLLPFIIYDTDVSWLFCRCLQDQPKPVSSCRSLRVHFPERNEGVAEILQDRVVAVKKTRAQEYLSSEACIWIRKVQRAKVEPENRLRFPQAIRQPVDLLVKTLQSRQMEKFLHDVGQSLVYL